MQTLQALVDRIPYGGKNTGSESITCPECGVIYHSVGLLTAYQQGLGDIIWCECGEKYTPEAAIKARVSKGTISDIKVTHKAKYKGFYSDGNKTGKKAFFENIMKGLKKDMDFDPDYDSNS